MLGTCYPKLALLYELSLVKGQEVCLEQVGPSGFLGLVKTLRIKGTGCREGLQRRVFSIAVGSLGKVVPMSEAGNVVPACCLS